MSARMRVLSVAARGRLVRDAHHGWQVLIAEAPRIRPLYPAEERALAALLRDGQIDDDGDITAAGRTRLNEPEATS